MKIFLMQVYNLMKQNRLYTIINIVGTAITIAFIMVVVMMYDFRTSDISPESDRSSYLYLDNVKTYRKQNNSDVGTSGLSKKTFELIFNNLDGVEDVTWYSNVSKSLCGLPKSSKTYNYFVRHVASNWFNFFDYKFINGRPFTKEEYEAHRFSCVIARKVAMSLFGTTDVVGKDFLVSYFPTKIVGVIEDVNSIFQTAYADAFLPFSIQNEENNVWANGLGGFRFCVVKCDKNIGTEKMKKEISRRAEMINKLDGEYAFELNGKHDHVEYTFFQGKDINASLVYAGLILMLLLVPAINISGLTHSQMQRRESEIAVRKAYGASKISLISKLFTENLVTTFFGGVLGYMISCLAMFIFRAKILGGGEIEVSDISFADGIMFRPVLFLAIFIICIIFNLLSVLLPAWLSMRREIASTLKGE